MAVFNWNDHCMLCKEFAELDSRHPEINKLQRVTTLYTMHDDMLLQCCDRRNVEWALEFKFFFMVILT